MSSKWRLFASIFQIVIGVLAITAFFIFGFGSGDAVRWIVTLVLSVAFLVWGIIGVVDHKTNSK